MQLIAHADEKVAAAAVLGLREASERNPDATIEALVAEVRVCLCLLLVWY
jgi:hypothetical protein